ncbi:MAG: GGDEF domain-containing protein [Actinobacteria bacterium]|nr:GGDEF domain-containing protein [Actinomycetota bacterium]
MTVKVWSAELSPLGAPPETDRPFDGLLRLLGQQLAESDVGLRVIYSWLERVRQQAGSEHAVLVIEDPSVGRQVFTAEADPLVGDRVERLVLHASAGLYIDPPVLLDREEVATALRLCRMAFELDVNRHKSMRDPLTGLHNRRGYEVELSRWTDNAVRHGWPFALVLGDLDNFKEINDRHGHAVGDEVLERVGREISRQLRRGDVASRVGGDEFALILSGAESEAIEGLTERLRDGLRSADLPAAVGLSWGWAICPSEAAEISQLYRMADARLYRNKQAGADAT